MNIREFVLSLDLSNGNNRRKYANGRSYGEGTRVDCPKCNSKKTLSVSNEDGVILYHCYKVRCNTKGAVHQGLTAHEIYNKIHKQNAVYNDEATELWIVPEYVVKPTADHGLVTKFRDQWNLHDAELLYDVKDKRAVFPIRENGRLIDATGRSLDGGVPKWFRYTGNAVVYTACQGGSNGRVVIVEDAISAYTICSMCPNVTGMAILGTSLSVKHMEHIQSYDKIIVALDPDASHKNLQYRREIVSWTGIDTIAMRLQDDLKYQVEEDIKSLQDLCRVGR